MDFPLHQVFSVETGFLPRWQEVYKDHKDVLLVYRSVGEVLLPVIILSDLDDFYLS